MLGLEDAAAGREQTTDAGVGVAGSARTVDKTEGTGVAAVRGPLPPEVRAT